MRALPPMSDTSDSDASETETTDESPQSSRRRSYYPTQSRRCTCIESHVRRRLIICLDGTSMVSDGALGSLQGNASNISRITFMTKDGEVKDDDGELWNQIRISVDAIGAVYDLQEQVISTITGGGPTGYEKKIKEICCQHACPIDEIFMFGYSRGAFVLRAVAGLLFHLKALKSDSPDFDKDFLEALRLYRAAQDKSKLFENRVFRHLSLKTNEPPQIKFMGLFDTVKMVNDSNLNDIGMNESVLHVRHALALFERRRMFPLQRFIPVPQLTPDRSLQEAWFAGSHGNLGGACEQDGLALWPLHWIMTEARKYGLVLGFKPEKNSPVTDPCLLIFPRDDQMRRTIDCANGIQMEMSNMASMMDTNGLNPQVDGGSSNVPLLTKERSIFQNDELIGWISNSPIGTFIHPSVFFLDQTNATMINFINEFPQGRQIRLQQQVTIPDQSQVFWDINREIQTKKVAVKPRILVCGQMDAGKTELINQVLGGIYSTQSHEFIPGSHDIDRQCEAAGKSFILYDSQGFETGKESNWEDVESFLSDRRERPRFQDQVHCIWYCTSTDVKKIQASDRNFAKIKLGGVPVIHVFTKLDRLRLFSQQTAVEKCAKEFDPLVHWDDIGDVPEQHIALVKARHEANLKADMDKRSSDWSRELGIFSSSIFISKKTRDKDSLERLLGLSQAAMTSERIGEIHAHAQDVFVNARITMAINKVAALFSQKISISNIVANTVDPTSQFNDIVESSIKEVASAFHFNGFDPIAFRSTIRSNLWPQAKKSSGAIWAYEVVKQGVIVNLLDSFIFVYGAWRVANGNYQVALAFVATSIDILLVLERLFWYGGTSIDEVSVKGACLYYLKKRPEVHKRLGEYFSRMIPNPLNLPTKAVVVKTLTELMDGFRYQRRVIPGRAEGSGM